MKKVNIELKIDSNSRRLEFCSLEDKNLNPKTHFTFKNGEWIAKFNNFPINSDHDLDIIIIAIGNPGSNSVMTVLVDGAATGTFNLFKPFNRNGYAQFNQEISL